MESFGDQWNNVFSNGFFSNEDDVFMAQLLGNSSLSNESSSTFSSAFFSVDDSTTPTYPNDQKLQIYPLSDNTNTNNIFTSSYSQENSYSASENYYLNESTQQSSSFSLGLGSNINSNSMSSISFSFGDNNKSQAQAQAQAQAELEAFVAPLHEKHLQILSIEPKLQPRQIYDNDYKFNFMENSKKRPQMFSDHIDVENQKKRNVKPKKSLVVKVNNNKQSSKTSSSCCSEGDDDINYSNSSINAMSRSQSRSEDVSCSKGKGSRGSASDPQSLYARKRREKINERLKILQNLVPNGTKVDISTMLEEAVQYVKFLQLQIKLLSSDDHWMYAPIAYNGMDIGLDMNITPPTTTTSSS